jgi:hypothetical protein
MGRDADHYEAEVNKEDVNMGSFTRRLNDRWENGWRLAHVYVHNSNTVTVWERREA